MQAKNLLRTVVLILMGLISSPATYAELAGDPNDPDFIHATMLISSPGKAIYQVAGHTFIRMQCPAADLDYCFSFENEQADGMTQLFKNVDGRFMSWPTEEYLKQFREEGRTISALPLNLKPLEKQRLWQVLDSLTMSGVHPFNIRKESCSGHILHALDIALYPSAIKALNSPIIGHPNGEVVKYANEGEGPWRCSMILMALGNDADIADLLYNHSFPIILASEWKDYYIVNPEGESRHLFLHPDIQLRPKQLDNTRGVTPMAVALVFLILSVITLGLRIAGKCPKFVWGVQVFYIIILTLGWVLLTIICASPSALAGWANYNFLLFNPLPLLLLPHKGRSPRQRYLRCILAAVWIIYGIVGPGITYSIPLAVGLFAISAAVVIGSPLGKAMRNLKKV